MNVDGDVAFFYGIYVRLHHLAEQDARAFDGRLILSLLLYTENTVAIGLDGVYEDMYRSLGNVVFRWCDGSGMSANATSQVHDLVSQAVADAPCSALRQWITESVLSCDFQRLSDVLTYFAREDRVLRHVYPDLRCRKPMFLRIAGEKQAARQMLWADLAFNWQDKHGNSLPATLARQCRLTAPLMEEWERLPLQEAAGLLDTVSGPAVSPPSSSFLRTRHTSVGLLSGLRMTPQPTGTGRPSGATSLKRSMRQQGRSTSPHRSADGSAFTKTCIPSRKTLMKTAMPAWASTWTNPTSSIRRIMLKEYHDEPDKLHGWEDSKSACIINGGKNLIAPNARQAEQTIQDSIHEK